MHEGHNTSWKKVTLLLGALAAGTVTTQLLPEYEPFVGKITYPTHSSNAAKANIDAPQNFSANNAGDARLTFVRKVN